MKKFKLLFVFALVFVLTLTGCSSSSDAPEEEKYLMSKDELKARIVTFMAGRASEEIVFDSVTTGASNDIEQATKIARAMVTQYGMSDLFGLMSLESVENRYLDGRAVLNCGDATAAQIDDEVKRILKESYDEAKGLLLENRELLDEIAGFLFKEETILGKEFMKMFRKAKGLPEPVAKEIEAKELETRVLEAKELEAKELETKKSEELEEVQSENGDRSQDGI